MAKERVSSLSVVLLSIILIFHVHSVFNYTIRFSPCVFLLKAGQALHIPKGCIHACRKLSRCELDDSDCHAELRQDYIRNLPQNEEEVCISIA